MATAAKVTDVPVSLIEEKVETGLGELLEGYRPTYVPGGEIKDEFDGRFTLLPHQPIPELSHAYADAYAAQDANNPARQIYAMVCDPDLPYRSQAVNDVEGFINLNLILPLGAGTVRCSHLNEARYVMFFDRPQGTSLLELIARQTRMHDTKVMDNILQPACNALLALRERKVHHGNIHPGMFFIGEASVLGECFSAPSGTLGHYLYEPLERLMADPLGHGEANEKADMYALGILIFELMYGLDHVKAMPREEFIARVMRQGTYQVFANGRDFSDTFQDFFRGILNDNAADRWGLDQLASYIGGKRFNMIAPSAPKDASRPFIFGPESIFSRRLLANALHRNWREAIKDIRALRIERWCEMSLHRPELGERIERALRIGADKNASERQVTDMMTRIFAVLDPTGPLRTKTLSLRPDAIPMMLAHLMNEKSPELPQLLNMIQTNVTTVWVEQLDSNKTPEMSQILWKLQKMKPLLDNKSLGFGIERVLYELNPSLCCQSPLLKPYHVTTVAEALSTLDAIAKKVGPDTSLVDRHIAGFIAAKIELNREIRLDDVLSIPELARNPELLMIRLLARGQAKTPRSRLVGLAAWSAMRIEKVIDEIHNRVIRKRLRLQLRKLAATGILTEVLNLIVNRDVVMRDTEGFIHAVALHEINNKRMDQLSSSLVLEYKSRVTGGRMAVTISYMALMITSYIVITGLMGI